LFHKKESNSKSKTPSDSSKTRRKKTSATQVEEKEKNNVNRHKGNDRLKEGEKEKRASDGNMNVRNLTRTECTVRRKSRKRRMKGGLTRPKTNGGGKIEQGSGTRKGLPKKNQ